MPKPILSELEYNASDVASAILSKADLSVTNENLGVADIESEFTVESGWAFGSNKQAYTFNGFVFLSILCTHAGGLPSHGEKIFSVSSSYKAITATDINTISHEGDLAFRTRADTDGGFYLDNPKEGGSDNTFYVLLNGFYRFTSV